MTKPALIRPRFIILLWSAIGACLVPLHGSPAKDWKALAGLIAEYAQNEGKSSAEVQGTLNLLKFRLESFAANHPSDERVWIARALLPEIKIQAALSLGFPADWAEGERELDALLDDPALPKKQRPDVEYAWISFMRARGDQVGLTDQQMAALMDGMERFGNENPRHRAAASVHLALGQFVMGTDPERAERAFLSARKKGDMRTAAEAERELAVLPYRNVPLDLRFTAIDGRPVDLAGMRGKIVLVDFWATWCGPCVRELPKVLAAYHQYKDRGLEIIGISLDENQAALKKFVMQRSMLWPQYYDGRGWENKISRRFAITSIPTMWLIDRDGRVISTRIRGGNLDYHLKKLLSD